MFDLSIIFGILVLVSLIICLSCYLAFYLDSGNNEYISVLTLSVILFVFTTFIKTAVSVYSSNRKCDQYSFSYSLREASKLSFYIVLVAIIVFIIHYKRTPYLEKLLLFPSFYRISGERYIDRRLVLYAAIAFWCSLSAWLTTTTLYYHSQIDGCKLTDNQLSNFREKLDKKLAKEQKKPKIKKVLMVN
jgi:hypothetical protein